MDTKAPAASPECRYTLRTGFHSPENTQTSLAATVHVRTTKNDNKRTLLKSLQSLCDQITEEALAEYERFVVVKDP